MDDPTTIKLKIPAQDFAGPSLFRPETDAVHSWAESLPVNNPNALVELLAQGLDELNRSRIPPELRYKLLEVLRPCIEAALANLVTMVGNDATPGYLQAVENSLLSAILGPDRTQGVARETDKSRAAKAVLQEQLQVKAIAHAARMQKSYRDEGIVELVLESNDLDDTDENTLRLIPPGPALAALIRRGSGKEAVEAILAVDPGALIWPSPGSGKRNQDQKFEEQAQALQSMAPGEGRGKAAALSRFGT